MTTDVSIIIPAFNEAGRLPPYLAAIQAHVLAAEGINYEVIVVDDGSGDGTADLVHRMAADWRGLSVQRHARNQGKGQALRTGMHAARGRLLLFTDADGATSIDEEPRLRGAIDAGADIAIGSRLIHGCGHSRQRTWCRGLSGRGFAWAVRRFFDLPIKDTQCGFKMFRREVCMDLMALCRESGYLLDLEVLALAHRAGYRIAEIPISWMDVPGSKVRLLSDGWKMGRGLYRIRRSMKSLPEHTRRGISPTISAGLNGSALSSPPAASGPCRV